MMQLSNPTDVYHAIADPNRRRLLDLLREEERSVKQLVPHFDVTVGAISQHLKVLLESAAQAGPFPLLPYASGSPQRGV